MSVIFKFPATKKVNMLKRKSRFVTTIKRPALPMRVAIWITFNILRFKFWRDTPGNLERFFEKLQFYILIGLGIVTLLGFYFGWFQS